MISKTNITTKSGCLELLNESLKMGPVGGIFNLAVQLSDANFVNQNASNFTECLAPKALATQYLDELSRKMCPDLHYFVVFSSVACGMGNAGQSNYGMANSVMERIVEKRCSDGLPAKAIQWGAVGDVGIAYDLFVKDKMANQSDMTIGGTIPQSISSCLNVMDALVTSSDAIVLSMVLAEKKFEDISELSTMEKILRILNVKNIKLIPLETTLTDLGMSSLVTIEIKQLLEREQKIFIELDDMRLLTVAELLDFVDTKKTKVDGNWITKSKSAITYFEYLIKNASEFQSYESSAERISKLNKVNGTERVLIIPGVDGFANALYKRIANNLKWPAYFLTSDSVEHKSIEEITKNEFEVSLYLVTPPPPFDALWEIP